MSKERSEFLEKNRKILSDVLHYQISMLNLRVLRRETDIDNLLFIVAKIRKSSANNLNEIEVYTLIDYLAKWLGIEKSLKQIELNPIDYMYELAQEFYQTQYDLELIREVLNARHKKESLVHDDELEEERISINNIVNSISIENETERDNIIKVRIGQGVFKRRLLSRSCECVLCKLSDRRFLIASHIKPWRDCNNVERLSIDNGLLFCPNHDSLFDQGYISFNPTGELLISDEIDEKTLSLLNIDNKENIYFTDKQHTYLNWHRELIYRGK
ncbi:HNH endonuclease [Sporosarcina sp. FSL K6-5500]